MTKYFMLKFELGEESIAAYESLLNPVDPAEYLGLSLFEVLEEMKAPFDSVKITILKETGIGLVPDEKI